MTDTWQSDTLLYFGRDPILRRHHHDEIAAHVGRAHELLALPDEQQLFAQLWGDDWQKRAHLRLVYAYQHSLVGAKRALPLLPKSKLLVGDLERLCASEAALGAHRIEWIVAHDTEHSVFAYERSTQAGERVVIVLNCTPLPRTNYRVGVRSPGMWHELLNTDAADFGGNGHGNFGGVEAAPVPSHDRPLSLNLTLPPLGALYLCPERQVERER